jgi:hypothetical protein
LRRLLARSSSRVVTVLGARDGLGATSIVVNLAAVLARSGKDVLVLDENLSHDNVANTLALKSRYDLLHVVRGDKNWEDVLLRGAESVRVLPVARAAAGIVDFRRQGYGCGADRCGTRRSFRVCQPVRRRAVAAGTECHRQRHHRKLCLAQANGDA